MKVVVFNCNASWVPYVPRVTNCNLWNGQQEEISSAYLVEVTFSCIQDGYEGLGNINQDPLFTSGTLGDYYLSPNSFRATKQQPLY